MTCVAVGTGNFVNVVRPAMPSETDLTVVAVEAHGILYADAGFVVRPKRHDGWPLFSTPHPGRMLSTGSVAGFALQLAMSERAAGIRGHSMPGLKYGERHRIVMAGDTGIGALQAVCNIGCRIAVRFCRDNRRH